MMHTSFVCRRIARVGPSRVSRHLVCRANSPQGGDEAKALRISQGNRMKSTEAGKGASGNLINAMSELAKQKQGPATGGTKTVFGPDQMSWKEVDEAVNEYPSQRVFTAIGEGSDDFRDSMVRCVETALERKVHPEAIVVRPSRAGKYFSVKIGPMHVQDAGEVVAVYCKMKEDSRMKWFL